MVPKLFATCVIEDGKYPKAKLDITNKAFCDFALLTKTKKGKVYQLSTQGWMIHTLMARMLVDYLWSYTLNDHFNDTGMLKQVVTALFWKK